MLQIAIKIVAKQWYFVTKIVLTYCEKKLFSITRTIFSHSRSEQFWQQNTNTYIEHNVLQRYFTIFRLRSEILSLEVTSRRQDFNQV